LALFIAGMYPVHKIQKVRDIMEVKGEIRRLLFAALALMCVFGIGAWVLEYHWQPFAYVLEIWTCFVSSSAVVCLSYISLHRVNQFVDEYEKNRTLAKLKQQGNKANHLLIGKDSMTNPRKSINFFSKYFKRFEQSLKTQPQIQSQSQQEKEEEEKKNKNHVMLLRSLSLPVRKFEEDGNDFVPLSSISAEHSGTAMTQQNSSNHLNDQGLRLSINIPQVPPTDNKPLTVAWTPVMQKSYDDSVNDNKVNSSAAMGSPTKNLVLAASASHGVLTNNGKGKNWLGKSLLIEQALEESANEPNEESTGGEREKTNTKPSLQKSISFRENYIVKKKLKEEERRKIMKNVRLRDFLQLENGFRLFATHLAKEFSSENLLFVLQYCNLKAQMKDCQLLRLNEYGWKLQLPKSILELDTVSKKKEEMSHEECLDRFQEMYDQYINDDALQLINISFQTRLYIVKQYQSIFNSSLTLAPNPEVHINTDNNNDKPVSGEIPNIRKTVDSLSTNDDTQPITVPKILSSSNQLKRNETEIKPMTTINEIDLEMGRKDKKEEDEEAKEEEKKEEEEEEEMREFVTMDYEDENENENEKEHESSEDERKKEEEDIIGQSPVQQRPHKNSQSTTLSINPRRKSTTPPITALQVSNDLKIKPIRIALPPITPVPIPLPVSDSNHLGMSSLEDDKKTAQRPISVIVDRLRGDNPVRSGSPSPSPASPVELSHTHSFLMTHFNDFFNPRGNEVEKPWSPLEVFQNQLRLTLIKAFDKAAEETYELMSRDSFGRFAETDEFNRFVKKIYAHPSEVICCKLMVP